ncbi:unnamed protein product [Laminaria digitata]
MQPGRASFLVCLLRWWWWWWCWCNCPIAVIGVRARSSHLCYLLFSCCALFCFFHAAYFRVSHIRYRYVLSIVLPGFVFSSLDESFRLVSWVGVELNKDGWMPVGPCGGGGSS